MFIIIYFEMFDLKVKLFFREERGKGVMFWILEEKKL